MAKQDSRKRVLIDEANRRVVVVTGVAAFIVVFCLIASRSLFGQLLYQNRIVSAQKATVKQLSADATAVANLNTAYAAFVSTPQNVLGGNSTGTGGQDGDNAKLVLDALPSKYDFPALATSLEKILTDQNVTIQGIAGSDDEVAQSANSQSANPQPVEIPFQISAKGTYDTIQALTSTFERSIRPIQIQSLTIGGDENNLVMSVTAKTYYQPEKTFKIGTKVIK